MGRSFLFLGLDRQYAGQLVYDLFFPFSDLVRGDPVLDGYLRYGSRASDGFEHYFGLKSNAITVLEVTHFSLPVHLSLTDSVNLTLEPGCASAAHRSIRRHFRNKRPRRKLTGNCRQAHLS